MEKTAILSECRRYRYELRRVWEPSLPLVQFIGLNPSTADETTDDATIRRLIGFGQRWELGGFIMTNLFAWRATKQSDLKRAESPIGFYNDAYLIKSAKETQFTVACWGNGGAWIIPRAKDVQKLLTFKTAMHCFGHTSFGFPKHPVRLPNATELSPF